jgi:hypothetical protein
MPHHAEHQSIIAPSPSNAVDLRGRAAMSFVLIVACLLLSSPAQAQLRIVNYNIAKLNGDADALEAAFAALHDDDKPGFAVPVSIFVFQEVTSLEINALESAVNASAPPGVSYTRGTFTTSSFEDNSGGAQAMFYRSGMLTEFVSAHQDIATGAGRNTDRWQLRLTGYNTPFAWLYVYGSHLKADTGNENQQERLNGVIAIRANADSLGANQHIIYSGDMNFYTNAEPGYLHFFTNGNGKANDPLGTGTWNGSNFPPNSANNYKHTQSPLAVAAGGLVGGGMNSRFDFQLSSNALHDGAGLSLIAGTYRSLGNDGMHYQQAIDNGNNFYYPGDLPRSNALANNLRFASDHIPLVADYQIPAMMAGWISPSYGRVIVGTPFDVSVNVTNPANVEYVFGADVLTYTGAGSLGLSGVVSDTVEPLGDMSVASFPLNTSTAGIRNGTVTLSSTSQGVQPMNLVLNTTGTVVRHSKPSFESGSQVIETTIPLRFDVNSGTHQFTANVYNVGFDPLQALLDLDSIDGVSPPFSYVSGIATGIGAAPATITFAFNTAGLSPGLYPASITIHTSDENIPGEGAADLHLTVNVSINGGTPCAADINGDAIVNVIDLLAVISAWGPCPASCAADVNSDGAVNVSDLLAVISGWGECP